jgi:hypothetical protein
MAPFPSETAGQREAGGPHTGKGQVERLNGSIEDATVKRYFYETHDQLQIHLPDFVDAYSFVRRVKTTKTLRYASSSAKPGLHGHNN